MEWDLVVIGAGAAGLLAAARTAERGRRVLLLEKNRRAGVKILMSGGTRCNLTHDTDKAGIIAAFGKPGQFLHSALAALDPSAVRAIVEAEGVETKVEPGGKVFPVSNRATDVLEALLARLTRSGAELRLGEGVTAIDKTAEGFRVTTAIRKIDCRKVLVTTGGKSYPGSGTTGDGYAWAAQFGHTIVTPRPALTPLVSEEPWVRELSGITIPDAEVRVLDPTKQGKEATLAQRRTGLLFTHFGLSGPAAMDVSRAVSAAERPRALILACDFLPSMREGDVTTHIHRVAKTAGKRNAAGVFPEAIPGRLAAALLARAEIAEAHKAAELSAAQRERLVAAIKRQPVALSGTRGFAQAEVTAGGVALDEVDSKTMQSKLAPGLLFAGEILDLDGPIGGYNFQAAFSTGWQAGENA